MNHASLSRLSCLLALALLLTSCAGGSRSALPKLMVQRLDWMDDVALAKSVKKLPITDPVREAELLRSMTQRGVAAGLSEQCVRSFFNGQMQAAKVRQEEWLREHPQGQTSYITVPDLTRTIRPALDKIGQQMIAQLVKETRQMSFTELLALQAEARQAMSRAGYSEAVMKPALQGLSEALGSRFKEPIR